MKNLTNFALVGLASMAIAACGNTTQADDATTATAEKAAEKSYDSKPAKAKTAISEQTVIDAQQTWGNGIVAISAVHSEGGDFAARATEHINTLYAYGDTAVMFKPTLAADDQFRETFQEALDYFIGAEGTEDTGFAIKGWTNVRWENNGIYTDYDSAMAMGNYYFTGPDGSETKVEYTFGYVLDDNGDLKINLHHSSLPYSPN